jgi:hypothetical protein
MKTFFNAVWDLLIEIGRVRAASAAARAGDFEIARSIIK